MNRGWKYRETYSKVLTLIAKTQSAELRVFNRIDSRETHCVDERPAE